MTTNRKTKRIEYIDALKGLIMSLVVLGHCAYFNLGVNVSSDGNLHFYFHKFLMPLFFFVSGFLTYKAGFQWNFKNIKIFLSKKIFQQVLSPLIFLCCYIHFREYPYTKIADPMKMGYWFTFALFNCFVLYAVLRKVCEAIKLKEENALVILVLVGLVLYILPTHTILNNVGISEDVLNIFSVRHLKYFFFFAMGIFIKKHYERLENILNGPGINIATIIFFIIIIFVDASLHNKIVNLLLAICGIIVVFGFFKNNNDYFSGNSKVARSLKFIGKRTLDIYFIHYFFLSYNLPNIVPFFSEHSLPMIEIVVSIVMGTVLIGVSLMISTLLRQSTPIAHYLFGENK